MFHLYQTYRDGHYYAIEADCSIQAYVELEWRTRSCISANVKYKPATQADMESYIRDLRIRPANISWFFSS